MDNAAVLLRALRNKADRRAFLRLQKQTAELAEATKNLATVTDTRIQALTDQVQALANGLQVVVDGLQALNLKHKRFATTVTSLVANVAQDVTVTWSEAWPDTAYGVWPAPPIVGAAAVGKVFASLKPGTKTTTDCVVTVVATQAVATAGLDVLGYRTGT